MTDKNEKLFRAIGKLNDDYIEEAYAESSEPKPAKSRKSIKRIVMLAAAALLSVSLVITVAANSDAIIAAMFERRQKLVDDKIGHIDESVTEGNITLTMESVKVERRTISDNFFGEFTVSFHNEDGNFENGIKYGGYMLEYRVKDGEQPQLMEGATATTDENGQTWAKIDEYHTSDDNGEGYSPFKFNLDRINYGLDKPSDTITLTGNIQCRCNTDYRMTFTDVTSYDGSIKYADKISVDFSVAEDEVQPLQQLDYKPEDVTFELEGVTFEIEGIEVYPDHMLMRFTNSNADRVNIAGKEYYAINYLAKLVANDEYLAKSKEFAEFLEAVPEKGKTEEEQAENLSEWMATEEGRKLWDELIKLSIPTADQTALNECYEIFVEINRESGAEVVSTHTNFGGNNAVGSTDGLVAFMDAQFSSPIYVNDITRVYAQKIGDPTKQVTIWVPAEDEGLAELNK